MITSTQASDTIKSGRKFTLRGNISCITALLNPLYSMLVVLFDLTEEPHARAVVHYQGVSRLQRHTSLKHGQVGVK
jgi:hypothetical protein